MSEDSTEPTPTPTTTPAAPSKKRPSIRRKGRERGKELLIVLGVLVAALAVLNIWSYMTLSNDNASLQSQLASLNSTYQTYQATHSHNNTEYEDLLDIINLEKSVTFLDNFTFQQGAGDDNGFPYSIRYAGYIEVDVNSTSSSTYVTILYEAFENSFDETIQVGRSGTAIFPVLPADNMIIIIIGNNNILNREAEHTIRIVYHY